MLPAGSRLGLDGCAVAVALTLALPAGLLAQGAVTGTVSGTVSSQRQPVPGVAVRLMSPALQGERVVTTGPNGDYVALGLPPGEYVIQFSKPGMSTLTRTATVDLSGTTRMDADMDVVAIEALTIRGDLPTPIATARARHRPPRPSNQLTTRLPVPPSIRPSGPHSSKRPTSKPSTPPDAGTCSVQLPWPGC